MFRPLQAHGIWRVEERLARRSPHDERPSFRQRANRLDSVETAEDPESDGDDNDQCKYRPPDVFPRTRSRRW